MVAVIESVGPLSREQESATPPSAQVLMLTRRWGWTTPPAEVLAMAELSIELQGMAGDAPAVLARLDICQAARVRVLMRDVAAEADPYEALGELEPSILLSVDRIHALLAGEPYYTRLSSMSPHPAMGDRAVLARCEQLDAALMRIDDSHAVLVFSSLASMMKYRVLGRADRASDPVYSHVAAPLHLALGTRDGISHCLQIHTGRDMADTSVDVALWDAGEPETQATAEGRQITRLLDHAITAKATDIAFEPQSDGGYRISIRRWGELVEPSAVVSTFGADMAQRVRQLLQTKSGANPKSVRMREPGDGHISYRSAAVGEAFIRASFIPLSHLGETRDIQSISLRLLPKETASIRVDGLNLQATVVQKLREAVHVPQGLVLIAGPMNCGKSTTIAGAVGAHVEAFGTRKKRLSVEDPVERIVEGVTQINVPTSLVGRDQRALDEQERFNLVLRGIKRHDVNVVWVGEVRDRESAEFCVAFSASGHLVLSTIHAQDELSAFDILSTSVSRDLRYQLCESISLVVSQRLVRTVCRHCSVMVDRSAEDQRRFASRLAALGEQHELPERYPLACPNTRTNCAHCDDGYAGHAPINGVLPFDRAVKDAAVQQVTTGDLGARRAIAAARTQTLFGSALQLLREGKCDLNGVLYF